MNILFIKGIVESQLLGKKMRHLCFSLILIASHILSPLLAAEVNSPSFELDVRPIFETHCISCHSVQNHQSGLVLETQSSVLEGGALGGPSIIPGKSQSSPLIQRLLGEKVLRMPPNGKPLSSEQMELIARWIDEMDGGTLVGKPLLDKPTWPWTPLKKPTVPLVKQTTWVRNPIDAFILAKLEEKGMRPSVPVSNHSLLRRLYFGLIGLPPTPKEMKQFLKDPSPKAYRATIERLLSDPRYGERWARHWLDLVRYGDSMGGALDYALPHMWRFRDYVIRVFNQDRPYNRFIKEQIAGEAYQSYREEGKIGTGFLNLQVLVEGSGDGRRDFLTDVVNTTGSVFLGVTLGCARCHDHKYDPISQRDYYRIEGFFAPMLRPQAQPLPFTQYELPNLEPKTWGKKSQAWEKRLTERKEWGSKIEKAFQEKVNQYRVLMAPQDLKDWVHTDLKKPLFPADTLMTEEEKKQFSLIERQRARFANPNSPARFEPMAYFPTEPMGSLGYAPTTFLLKGGDPKAKQEVIKPGFLVAASKDPNPVNLEGWSGTRRKKLAEWIASPQNPLTARVMVNRIWHYHFGKGLVTTPSDFGKNGGGTVHPDLIDWLAAKFIETDWSVKEIQRLILSSNIYRQSMHNTQIQEYRKIDSMNQYLWRMPPKRLEAEAIRDSILAVSGELNPIAGGPGFFPELDDQVLKGARTWWEPDSQQERNRRSIYMLQQRIIALPLIRVFDGPNINETCAVRDVTTATPQVFALFNSQFAHRKSRAMAQRIVREVGQDRARQVERAFQLALQRRPSAEEKVKGLDFLGFKTGSKNNMDLQKITFNRATHDKEVLQITTASRSLSDFCLAMFNLNEFIFLQ